MSQKINLQTIANGEGPDYILLTKYDGIYRTYTTAERLSELIKNIISSPVLDKKYKVILLEEIKEILNSTK